MTTRRESKWYQVEVRKADYETLWVQSTTPEGAKRNALKQISAGQFAEFDEVKAVGVKRWHGTETK